MKRETIVRGDVESMRDHLNAIRQRAPELLKLYQALAKHTISVERHRYSIMEGQTRELTNVLK